VNLVMCWQTVVVNMLVVIFGYWNCSTEFACNFFWCHVGLCYLSVMNPFNMNFALIYQFVSSILNFYIDRCWQPKRTTPLPVQHYSIK
jgi:hypothetical protein